MPKLLVFAPCEKVIISQDENNPTLIAILSTIGGELEGPPPEPAALGPMRWSIFALWQKEPGEDGEAVLEQRIRLISPTGRVAIDSSLEFKMPVRTHRMVAHIGLVPVGDNGDWEVQLFMYKKGDPVPDKALATYPLEIRFTHKTPGAAAVEK